MLVPPVSRLPVAIALRSGGLLALSASALAAAPTLLPDDDGLGAWVLWMTLLVAGSGLAGLIDGFRWRYRRLAAIWMGTATLVAVGAVLVTGRVGDLALTVADLRGTAPLVACVVALPALISGGLVALVTAATTRPVR